MANDENRRDLLQLFNKFMPDAECKNIMENSAVAGVRVDKAKKMIEADAEFRAVVSKDKLYKIEDGICKAYAISSCRICPKYKPELYRDDYIDEVLKEARRRNIISETFIREYTVSFSGDNIDIGIKFGDGALSLVSDAEIHKKTEKIIADEFGIIRNISFSTDSNYEYDNSLYDTELERIKRDAYEKALQTIASAPNNPSYQKEFNGISRDGDLLRTGNMVFDISDPMSLYGDVFEINPVPMHEMSVKMSNVSVIGESFGLEMKENFKKTKIIYRFYLTDAESTILCKVDLPSSKAYDFPNIKDGSHIAVKGRYVMDERDMQLFLIPESIMQVKRVFRQDDEEEKRVELHLHTTMSTMDAVITPNDAVRAAKRFGHKAVAITDHGNVQGFQEAMLESEATGEKVIYGMEGYFVNDEAKSIYSETDENFDGEFVVFDIETTGLSPLSDKITEIGAALIKNREIIDTFDLLINPGVHVPEEITAKTGINDEMLKDAPDTETGVAAFLRFAGDRMLVAHNASFDTSFIRKAASDYGFDFNNGFIDTLSVSRYLNPELKSHRLDRVAEHYKLGDFEHHRAEADAVITAKIFLRMIEKLDTEGVHSAFQMARATEEHTDPLKLPTRHIILLVKNKDGLKNLYKLVSEGYLKYYKKNPRIPKTVLAEHRNGLIIGSACVEGELYQAYLSNKTHEEIKEIAGFYDYLEIQPVSNNSFLVLKGELKSLDEIREINKKIVALGDELNIPVVATGDVHFEERYDEIYRKILLAGMKYQDADNDLELYFRTTREMLDEFSYLGEEKAREVVITNTNLIADMISYDIRPFPKGTFTPNMEGADENLQKLCYEKARALYGDPLPEIVSKRLEKELSSIIKNGFSVLYMIAQKLVKYSESQGYLVGSRGSVGSSFVASMAGISEVNPLIPHYYCPECKYSEFISDGSYGSGFDLPDKNCPRCGAKLNADGHDIPFETFLGFFGDKSPDIDLNFSGDVQGKVHKYTEALFGSGNVYRAGTIGEIAEKTAYGYVKNYLEDRKIDVSQAETERLKLKCVGVKRTTGQHPGGIVVIPREHEIYDFCPIQHPADDAGSDIITTHFTFSYLHDTLLKLDELGHDVPTKYKLLEMFTGTSVMDVPMNDPEVYRLFESTEVLGIKPADIGCNLGTLGLPEFGTAFVQPVVCESKPKNFADLLQISGLTHGNGLWVGNAQTLINEKTCTISNVIGTRDSIMLQLIRYGLPDGDAFNIMEFVRKNKKGKPIPEKMIEVMKAHNVDAWYISSLQKIRYMFPKAHAAAYVMSAIRMGWYKIYRPLEFYCAYYSAAPDGFDGALAMAGIVRISSTLREIEQKGKEATQKEAATYDAMQLASEYLARGFKFLPVDLYKSDATMFLPEDGRIRLPLFSLPGLGISAAQNIQAARNDGEFISVDDLKERTRITKAVIEILDKNGVLRGIPETSQMSLF